MTIVTRLTGIAVLGGAGELYQGILVEPYTLISPSPAEMVVPLLGLLIGLSVGLAGAPAGYINQVKKSE